MDFYSKCCGDLFHPGGFDLTRRAIEYCDFKQGAIIADIGCGTGESAKRIEKEFDVRVLKFEPSHTVTKGNEDIICASAENLPVEDGLLDGVLCECSLSLCVDINKALCNLNRFLKNSGMLIISDVYSKTVQSVSTGLLKHLYTKEMFLSFLNIAGFEIVLFEDYSRELTKMFASLIMNDMYEQYLSYEMIGELKPKDIGYFLIIAKKIIRTIS